MEDDFIEKFMVITLRTLNFLLNKSELESYGEEKEFNDLQRAICDFLRQLGG